jgi:hypothetical protein
MTFDEFLTLINHPDPCATMLLILLLVAIGSAMVRAHSDLHAWGYRICAAVFVLYVFYGFATFQPADAADLIRLVLLALATAGLGLGSSWIVLAVGAFIHHYAVALPRARLQTLADAQRRASQRAQEERKQEALEAERRAAAQARSQGPAVPRTEHVKQAAERASQDFETDAEVIRSLGLDSEERDAALLQARQKLIRRLKEILA